MNPSSSANKGAEPCSPRQVNRLLALVAATATIALQPLALGITYDVAAGETEVESSVISGSQDLTKTGDGKLVLKADNTYTGTTTVHDGTLDIATGGSITHSDYDTIVGKSAGDVGAFTIQDSGSVTNQNTYLGYESGSSGTADVAGTWTNSGFLYVGLNGTGSLTIKDSGSVTNDEASIGNRSDNSGTAVVAGTWNNRGNLFVGNYSTGSLTIQEGGTVTNAEASIGRAYGSSGTADVAGTWNNSSHNFYVGYTGAGNLTIQDGGKANVKSGSGITKLTNWGPSTGTLTIAGSTEAGVLNTASVHGGSGTATLNFDHADSDYHFTNNGAANGTAIAITGSTTVNHTGSGTTTLDAANTYTGGTTISAGTVRIDNDAGSVFGTGNVTLANGATLAGSGSFSGSLDVSGALNPGDSPGTMSTGSQVWSHGASLLWEINDADGVAGTNWDFLDIAGSLTFDSLLDNAFEISLFSLTSSDISGDLFNFDSTENYTFSLLSASGGIFGFSESLFHLDTDNFTNAYSGTWSIATDSNNLNLHYTYSNSVPDTSATISLFALSFLTLVFLKRRF